MRYCAGHKEELEVTGRRIKDDDEMGAELFMHTPGWDQKTNNEQKWGTFYLGQTVP